MERAFLVLMECGGAWESACVSHSPASKVPSGAFALFGSTSRVMKEQNVITQTHYSLCLLDFVRVGLSSQKPK